MIFCCFQQSVCEEQAQLVIERGSELIYNYTAFIVYNLGKNNSNVSRHEILKHLARQVVTFHVEIRTKCHQITWGLQSCISWVLAKTGRTSCRQKLQKRKTCYTLNESKTKLCIYIIYAENLCSWHAQQMCVISVIIQCPEAELNTDC